MGSIVVTSPQFVAWLGGLSLACWLIMALVARAHKRWLALPALIVAFVLTAATAADAVNMHYGYLPQLDNVVGEPTWPQAHYDVKNNTVVAPRVLPRTGEVVPVQISGTISGLHASTTLVYVPPEYFASPQQRFPVIYMLHGTPGVPVDWFRSAQAAHTGDTMATAGNPAILVAPPVSSSWFDDSECVNRPHEHIEDFLTLDVVPKVDTLFRTVPDRTSRTVAGVSAGGFCALNIGLKHRDMFGSIIDMSGYDRPTHSGGMVELFGRSKDLNKVVYENSPSSYVPHLESLTSERIWLSAGRSDRAGMADTTEIARLLRERGAEVELSSLPGGHDYNVWRTAIARSFPWAVKA